MNITGNSPLILIADDNDDNRQLYVDVFTVHGLEVIEARDGAEALELAITQHPQAVVIDVHMPRMDGMSVVRAIRSQTDAWRVVILVLTASDGHEEEALLAGANCVCVKPCLPDALVAQIFKLLSGETGGIGSRMGRKEKGF